MREFYSIGMSNEKTKYFNITKVDLYSMFTDPRTNQQLDSKKRRVCMDWFHFQTWKENWTKMWFNGV